jgi:hypothetical protein
VISLKKVAGHNFVYLDFENSLETITMTFMFKALLEVQQ